MVSLIKRTVLAHLPDRMRHWVIRRAAGRGSAECWHLDHASLLYVQVPKVATRSIQAALGAWAFPGLAVGWKAGRRGDTAFGCMLDPRGISRLKSVDFSFAFVRDPLSRLVSCYRDKVALSSDGKAPRLARTVYPAYGIQPGMPFPDFVDIVARVPDCMAERHFRSQHTFLFHEGKCVVDFVARMEALDSGWQELQDRFGFPDLPHLNQAERRPARSSYYTPEVADSYYTPEVAERAAERYAEDIDLLGYEESIGQRLSQVKG